MSFTVSIGTNTTKHRQRLDCFICCCDRCLVFILFHLGEFCIFLPPLHYIYGRSYLLEGVCFFVVYFCCLGICCTSALWFFVFARSWFSKVCVFVLYFFGVEFLGFVLCIYTYIKLILRVKGSVTFFYLVWSCALLVYIVYYTPCVGFWIVHLHIDCGVCWEVHLLRVCGSISFLFWSCFFIVLCMYTCIELSGLYFGIVVVVFPNKFIFFRVCGSVSFFRV